MEKSALLQRAKNSRHIMVINGIERDQTGMTDDIEALLGNNLQIFRIIIFLDFPRYETSFHPMVKDSE
ncbi:hypothetical protein KIN20_015787 [Parelaphostrongylus tenuis]|uniref:Uncharacterized protein n=1 Tax=Parelaphostrongylus tenuis TaxID=148309 RepID=A0AAD5MXT0_PARTN|nr:hypothetical protein KIN20_015787 [Parelaphostrongylus tenuis]